MKRHFLGAFEADDFGSWLSSFKERVSSIKRENEAFDLDFKRRKIRDAAKERIQHGFETIRREQPVNSWSHLEQNQEPESPSGTLSDTVQKYREHSLRLEDLEDRITEPHEQWRAVYVKDGDSQDFASIVIPTDKEEFESSEEAYENEEDLTDQGTRRSYLQDPVGTSEFIPATSSNDGDETDHIQDSIQLDDSETLCEQHHLVQPQKLSISSHIINLDSEDETDEVPDSIINTTAGYIEFEESSDEQSDSEVDHVEFDVVIKGQDLMSASLRNLTSSDPIQDHASKSTELSGSLYEGSYRTRAVPYERENVGDEMAEDEISEPPVSDYATITASEKRFCQDNIFCGDVSNEALIEESALNIPFIQSSTGIFLLLKLQCLKLADPTTSDDTFRLQDLTVINNLSFVREADTDIDQIAQEQGQVLMNNVENMQSTSPRSLRIRKKRNWSETEEDSSPIKSSNETSLLKPGGPPRDAVTDFSASKEPSTPTNRGRRRSNGTVRERSNRKGGSKESKTAVKSCPIAEDRPVTPDDIKRSHLEIDGTELLAPEIRAGHLLRNGKDRDITPLSATVGFHHKLFPDHEHGRSKKK